MPMFKLLRRVRVTLSVVALVIFARAATVNGASDQAVSDRPFPHAPAWVADQTLYEVNLRQFSAEGNVEAFSKQLPRLKELGVGTLWFMPVNPIGVTGRSGKLGSPYAVSDFTTFNSELGSVEQFKAMVDQAHRMGMYVIIDWVATHTALDHPWITQHPDWYKHDAKGNLVHPMPAWADVVGLNYDSPELRKTMLGAMAYWVREVGVDGFRCDSAEFVPLDFWCQVRNTLRKIKPVFMLAEGNNPELMNYAFDSAYAWYLPPNMEGIANGTKTVADLTNFFKAEATILPADGFRLNYTSNHDMNAWEGTTRELLKDSAEPFAVLTFTAPGMPLIYNGQEAGIERRLNFFDRDPITWRDDPIAALYRSLAQLKRSNLALWDGNQHAPMQFLAEVTDPAVLAFQRQSHGDTVVVELNLSSHQIHLSMPTSATGLKVIVNSASSPDQNGSFDLGPWGYRVWANTP